MIGLTWDEDIPPNDCSRCSKLEETVRKMDKQIKRLRKRLIEKQKYEAEMLIQTGATPQYITAIRKKDEAALKED